MSYKFYREVCDFTTRTYEIPREFFTQEVENFIANTDGIYHAHEGGCDTPESCFIGARRDMGARSPSAKLVELLCAAGYTRFGDWK